MSNVISGFSSGPGGTSNVSGVGRSSNNSGLSVSRSDYVDGSSVNDYYAPKSSVIYSNSLGSTSSSHSNIVDYANQYNFNSARSANSYYDDRLSEIMRYNERMYNNALSYSKDMSNTAMQRLVDDLKAAGLNPILAARLGGASYSMPSVPYITSVANPYYNNFDSSALGNMYNYETNKESNRITEANNIRDNIVRMNMNEFDNKVKMFTNFLDNFVSRANTTDRITADKEMQTIQNEFEKIENEKNRETSKGIAFQNNIFSSVNTILYSLSRIASSFFVSPGGFQNIFSSFFGGSNENIIDGQFSEISPFSSIS